MFGQRYFNVFQEKVKSDRAKYEKMHHEELIRKKKEQKKICKDFMSYFESMVKKTENIVKKNEEDSYKTSFELNFYDLQFEKCKPKMEEKYGKNLKFDIDKDRVFFDGENVRYKTFNQGSVKINPKESNITLSLCSYYPADLY